MQMWACVAHISFFLDGCLNFDMRCCLSVSHASLLYNLGGESFCRLIDGSRLTHNFAFLYLLRDYLLFYKPFDF